MPRGVVVQFAIGCYGPNRSDKRRPVISFMPLKLYHYRPKLNLDQTCCN